MFDKINKTGPVTKEVWLGHEFEGLESVEGRGAGKTLAIVAEEITGLHLPPEIIKKWKDLLVSMRIVDHRLDHMQDENERREFVSKLNLFLDGEAADFSHDNKLQAAMNKVRTLSDELPDQQKKFLISSLKRILTITQEIKTEKDPTKFTNMTRLEGQVTAKIFLQFLPEDFGKSPKYHKSVQAFTRLGRAGNSFDTFVDLPDDYKSGQSAVRPTPLNRLLLLGAVITDGAAFLKNAKLSPRLAANALKVSKNIILNRLKK